jgi:hypothetical protein
VGFLANGGHFVTVYILFDRLITLAAGHTCPQPLGFWVVADAFAGNIAALFYTVFDSSKAVFTAELGATGYTGLSVCGHGCGTLVLEKALSRH